MKYPYTPEGRFDWLGDRIRKLMNDFMDLYGETVANTDEILNLVEGCVEQWIESSDYFYDDEDEEI